LGVRSLVCSLIGQILQMKRHRGLFPHASDKRL
jgi:hypothetical protein